jgi:predicted nucleic acid-binding Zn ribbon protein
VSAGGPRRLSAALEAARADAVPATLLAAVQGAWRQVAGEAVAAQAEPVSERKGVVTVACRSATWAQELDLMGPELTERLRSELREDTPAGALDRLRFTADAARHQD